MQALRKGASPPNKTSFLSPFLGILRKKVSKYLFQSLRLYVWFCFYFLISGALGNLNESETVIW